MARREYSVATRLETVDSGPEFAEIIATPADGFPRSAEQLLSHADAAMFAHKRRHSGVV
jgi:hypothetical protein